MASKKIFTSYITLRSTAGEWKRRWFVLTDTHLKIYNSNKEIDHHGVLQIELQEIKGCHKHPPQPPNYEYGFRLFEY